MGKLRNQNLVVTFRATQFCAINFLLLQEVVFFLKMTQIWKACLWWPERAEAHEGQEVNDNQSVNTHKMLEAAIWINWKSPW